MGAGEGRRLALIIGSSQYQDQTLRQLITPGQDAEALARVLADARIGGFEVKTLINRSATEILQEIEGFFADRKRDDLLLVYFSGHGIKDDVGRLFLATPDTQRSRLRSTAIPAPFIHEAMDGSRSRRQVLILDCCHSGAFPEGMTHKGAETVGIGEQFKTGRGRVILTASNAIQYAFEGGKIESVGETKQSVFTRQLVRGLETGEADRNRDGLISLDELYDYVHDQVTSETPQQTPEIWQFGVEGDIVIARNPHPPPPATSPVTPDEVSDSVARRRIQALWTDALDFFYTGEWAKARDALKRVMELQPDFRDAADKLKEAEHHYALAESYAKATTAEAAGRWEEAITHYARVIELDANYRDAAARLAQAKKQFSLARLYEDARALARDERWESVLGVFAKIDASNPKYPDPDGLRAKAETERRNERLAAMYTEALEAMNRREWKRAIQGFEALEREQRDYRQTRFHLAKAREQLAAFTSTSHGEVKYGDELEWRSEQLAAPTPPTDMKIERAQVGSGFWFLWVLASIVGPALGVAVGVFVAPGLDLFSYAVVGAVIGASVGITQWLVLRRHVSWAMWWVLASTVSSAVGNAVGVSVAVSVGSFGAVSGAVFGASVGITQWLVLRRHVSRAIWWMLASTVGSAVGDAVGAPVAIPVAAFGSILYWAVFGAVSGAVAGAITATVLVWLLRHPLPEQ